MNWTATRRVGSRYPFVEPTQLRIEYLSGLKANRAWHWTSSPCKAKMWEWNVLSARSVSFDSACVSTQTALWSPDIGLSDSFVVVPRYQTDSFVVEPRYRNDSIVVEPRYRTDSFVVVARYRTKWFIHCGAKISDWGGGARYPTGCLPTSRHRSSTSSLSSSSSWLAKPTHLQDS